jgi:hypothetical protein
MTTPTGDYAFLQKLELDVSAELTLAETSQPPEDAIEVPISEWLSDPADTQRYEVSLRILADAVSELEDDTRPGSESSRSRSG